MDRFWKRVNKTETCWLWTGSTLKGTGYGSFTYTLQDGSTRSLSAHRFAYEHLVGPIPKRLYVCHSCDVRICVRPDHLFLGTPTTNVADMIAKCRHSRGADRPNSRLTRRKAESILREYAAGHTQEVLAGRYRVSVTAIHKIVHGEMWSWVDGPRVTKRMQTKLTPEQVAAIRLRRSLGTSVSRLAKLYNVTRQTIYRVVHWKDWRHVH